MGGLGLGISQVFPPRVGFSGAVDWWLAGGASGCLVAYQPKGAASLAASYVNLANPGTLDAVEGVAPTFDAGTGWTFNGTDQYLYTGVIPVAQDYSMLARFVVNAATPSSVGSPVLAYTYVHPATYIFGWQTGWNNATVSSHGNVTFSSVVAGSSGVYAVAGLVAYKDGAEIGTMASSGASVTSQIAIGRRGTLAAAYSNMTLAALVIYDNTLSAGEVAAVSAAMAAL